LSRPDDVTILRVMDDLNRPGPMDYLDNVSSYGFIPQDFDREYEEQIIDYAVRGVH
jgi:hypothetical protein